MRCRVYSVLSRLAAGRPSPRVGINRQLDSPSQLRGDQIVLRTGTTDFRLPNGNSGAATLTVTPLVWRTRTNPIPFADAADDLDRLA